MNYDGIIVRSVIMFRSMNTFILNMQKKILESRRNNRLNRHTRIYHLLIKPPGSAKHSPTFSESSPFMTRYLTNPLSTST